MNTKILLFILSLYTAVYTASDGKECLIIEDYSHVVLQKELVGVFLEAHLEKGHLGELIVSMYEKELNLSSKMEENYLIPGFLKSTLPNFYSHLFDQHKALLCSMSRISYNFLCEVQKAKFDKEALAAVKRNADNLAVKVFTFQRNMPEEGLYELVSKSNTPEEALQAGFNKMCPVRQFQKQHRVSSIDKETFN